MDKTWIYEEKVFRADHQKEMDAVFTLYKRYIGCRGF